MEQSRIFRLMSGRNGIKWSVTFKGILAGVIAGLLAVLYRLLIEFGTEHAVLIYAWLDGHLLYLLAALPLALVLGLLINRLMRYEPMAAGSGIPQVEGQVLYGMKMRAGRILFVRFASGVISSLFGLSLGREGPSIQIGACGSQLMAEKISRNRLEENYLITGGAAAGLAAAFNAPLSGIVFALEEIHRSFSPRILIAATMASLVADMFSKYIFGLTPVLHFENIRIPSLPIHWYLLIFTVGIVSGLAGAFVNRALLRAQLLYKKLPFTWRIPLALALAIPVGLCVPAVLGGGQGLIFMAEEARVGLGMLLVFLLVKLLFTCTSFGSGLPGGIFLPILSMGAMTGGAFGLIAYRLGMPGELIPLICVCGMAGTLSASVKAPVTSILLIAEMTGSLVSLLPVAFCAFTALLVSDLLKITPIYETLLERMREGIEVEAELGSVDRERSGKTVLLEMGVEPGSCVDGCCLREVTWPSGSLVVGIHRGATDLIPNGRTRIRSGDYLVVVSFEHSYQALYAEVKKLCQVYEGEGAAAGEVAHSAHSPTLDRGMDKNL